MPPRNRKTYNKKNRKRIREYNRNYMRKRRARQHTCETCLQPKEPVIVRVCDCNRHLLKHFDYTIAPPAGGRSTRPDRKSGDEHKKDTWDRTPIPDEDYKSE
jgi:hypothetical protein